LGDANIVMQRLRCMKTLVNRFASGLATIFNRYCEQRGIPRTRDEFVYPLKFWALNAQV
jgi:hypothetical protein